MYLVISKWKAKEGKEVEFERLGMEMQMVLRGQPGVTFAEVIENEGIHTAVTAYIDEATYRGINDNEQSAVRRAAAELHVEEVADWLGSERGETESYAGTPPIPTVATV